MRTFTFKVGVFGVPVELHASFALAAIGLTFPFWGQLTLWNVALAGPAAAIIIGSVIIHQLAHLAVARRLKIPVARINMHLIGGVSQFGARPVRLSRDLALMFAGSAASFALAVICLVLLVPWLEPHMIKGGCEWMQDGYDALGAGGRLLAFALFVNLGLALIGLLPLRPLDGSWNICRGLWRRVGWGKAGLTVAMLAFGQTMAGILLLAALAIVGMPA